MAETRVDQHSPKSMGLQVELEKAIRLNGHLTDRARAMISTFSLIPVTQGIIGREPGIMIELKDQKLHLTQALEKIRSLEAHDDQEVNSLREENAWLRARLGESDRTLYAALAELTLWRELQDVPNDFTEKAEAHRAKARKETPQKVQE